MSKTKTKIQDLTVGMAVNVDRSHKGKVSALVSGHQWKVSRERRLKTVAECWREAHPGEPEMLKSQRSFDSWGQTPIWDSAVVEMEPPAHSARKPIFRLVTVGRLEVLR